MGVFFKCKRTGTSYALGYFGMAKLRIKVAELCCPEFGAAYKETFHNAVRLSGTAQEKEAFEKRINGIIRRCLDEKKVHPKVVDFCLQPDTKGAIRYGACKVIYDGVKGAEDDWCVGYAGWDNPFTWMQFVALLKECYDNKSDLVWY